MKNKVIFSLVLEKKYWRVWQYLQKRKKEKEKKQLEKEYDVLLATLCPGFS